MLFRSQAVVFKMESHNHPSFIEPYQGAATGVGGICRDVFTMGARPIALADCLRFGRPDSDRTRYLLGGVVAGIAGYGNSFGVANVAGDVKFDDSYDGNILVNAFCLGLARTERIFRGTARGEGNPVLYVGAKTGRDGIHGATMASAEFVAAGQDASVQSDADAKRPAVQVGDPFMEKLLLEACLELMESDVLVGIQDMGAAGLTSSAVEMAARAGSGIELELDNVPCREQGMTPYELMLSESQERMLMVVERGREEQAMAVFAKWDLDAAVIGRVTDSGRVVVRASGEVYADLPADLLADGVQYDRPTARPAYLDSVATFAVPERATSGAAVGEHLLALLSEPDIASKAWVYRQYDHNVRHGTVIRPGAADAGVVRIMRPQPQSGASAGEPAAKAIAISAGCQARHVYLAPYEGTRLVVAEAYANLVAVGARPIAVTNCLNFGNPEKPEIMWQLAESIRGLGDACRQLETPVVSGNVSLYNETDGVAIKPTPMVAMVGLLGDARAHTTMGFAGPDHEVAVLGALAGSLAGSEYLACIAGRVAGVPAPLDVAAHRPVFAAALAMIERGFLASAHDVSEGGLAVAIAESAIAGPESVGVEVKLEDALALGPEELLFGEAPARFVISFQSERRDAVMAIAREHGVRCSVVGRTGGKEISFDVGAFNFAIDLARAKTAYQRGFLRVVE